MTLEPSLIYPMFAMVLLTFGVFVALFRSRYKSVQDGSVKPVFFKVYQGQKEPDRSAKLARHFTNIFETPTLFYVACLSALVLGIDALSYQILAWVYVALRALHAYIHAGKNKIQHRMYVYFSSWFVLILMWLYLTVSVSIG